MNTPADEIAAPTAGACSPRTTVTTFVVLCYLFSSPIWYLSARAASAEKGESSPMFYSLAVMGCPALAAFVTSLWRRRTLRGFGWGVGKVRWLLWGAIIPVLAGLAMFSVAWISGVAPIDAAKFSKVLSLGFIPYFLVGIGVSCVAAMGEEIGWRGLFVPELARCTGFSGVALISGAIWTVWHIPLILFGSYHGTGPVWLSLAAFVPLAMVSGIAQAWLRLASGSVWGSVLMHGFWNYFIQAFFPYFTRQTPAGEKMLGEFGWLVPVFSVLVAPIFWRLGQRLPDLAPGACAGRRGWFSSRV
ncbi:MAG: CPBP family intramembrane metalloprotease [Opitutaceae bacterium]|nr:CPBP family intramembrane metalloprotease [Opitutaceae bacterium]